MKKSLIIELFIFIVLLAALGFVGAKFIKHTFDIGTTYHVSFHDIYGIEIGSPVRILGVDIGHVTKIQSSYDEIFVDFVVTNDKVKIPQGTRATIEFFGLAGSRSIELTPPNGKTDGQGVITGDPIRLGDALAIMSKFARAMMVSVGGLYEFAKNRTQGQVEETTAKFLTTTKKTNIALNNVTSTIEEGGAKLHKSFEGTTKGMTRVYDDAEKLNVSHVFNIGRYAANVTKQSLIKFHRSVKDFNKSAEACTNSVSHACNKINNIKVKIEDVDGLYKAFDGLDDALNSFDKSLTQENLDKVYDMMDRVRIFSENLKNEI